MIEPIGLSTKVRGPESEKITEQLKILDSDLEKVAKKNEEFTIIRDLSYAKLTDAQKKIIQIAEKNLSSGVINSYYLTDQWSGLIERKDSCDPWKNLFFPVLFTYSIVNSLEKAKRFPLVIFDNVHARDRFEKVFKQSVIAFQNIIEKNCCMPLEEDARFGTWLFPKVIKETTQPALEMDWNFSCLRSDYKRSRFLAEETLGRIRENSARVLPVCSLDSKSIDSALELYAQLGASPSKPTLVILFLERDRWFASSEWWRNQLKDLNDCSFFVVTKIVNQLPSPNRLRRGKYFVFSTRDCNKIRGTVEQIQFKEYDAIFEPANVKTLKKALLSLGGHSQINFKLLFSLLSKVCNLSSGEELVVDPIDKSCVESLSDEDKDSTLASLYKIIRNIGEYDKETAKEKFVKTKYESYDLTVFPEFSQQLSKFPKEKVTSLQTVSPTLPQKLLIFGVPKINENQEIIKLKELNAQADKKTNILIAGTLEEILFDILFSNEIFYSNFFSKNPEGGFIDHNTIQQIMPGAGKSDIPTEEDLTKEFFSDYAEMKKFRKELEQKKAIKDNPNEPVSCLCLNVIEESGNIWSEPLFLCTKLSTDLL